MDKIDVLSRDEFVDQLVKLTETIAENKKSVSFAIDGKWGSGKSFVLDMFEERLEKIQSENTKTEKYLIVRYNCWKYDYYEEPLVAIVTTIIDTINEKTELLSGEQKEKFKGVLKAVGAALLSMANNAVKNATGADVKAAYDVVKAGVDAGKEQYEKMQEYDMYFSFKQALHSLQSVLNKLGETYTIVFLIDELDRCLPEYAIKVLERLHHLVENTSGVINIMAIDKSQLKTSITRIYGFQNADEYLKKFIQFTLSLNIGSISEKITDKYSDYIALFDKNILPIDDSVEEFMQAIFKYIDVRTQEQLIERTKLVHTLLYSEVKDYSFMCMELLLAVMICVYKDESCFTGVSVDCKSFDKVFLLSDSKSTPLFSEFFKKKFESIQFERRQEFSDEPIRLVLPYKPTLYGSIIYTWYWMHEKDSRVMIQHTKGDAYEVIANSRYDLKKFAETIKIIQ